MLDRTAHPPDGLSATERRRRERRLWRLAFLASLVAHVLVFLVWRSNPVYVYLSPFAAAGPRAGDDRAARGSLQAVSLAGGAAARPVVPPEIPLPTPEEVDPVEFEEVIEPVEVGDGILELDLGAMMGEVPGDLQPGTETGTGRGDGGTAEEGLFRLVPPTPRGMIIPPANRSLRGQQVEVWVFVDESGRVVADSTRLRPPTPDRDFNRRLLREAAEWLFRPAMQGGRAVASWFPYTISM